MFILENLKRKYEKNTIMKIDASKIKKQLSNPSSTGGLGTHFENRVQTSFAILMLTGGFSPCLPIWPIVKIKLQGKYQGFETDDIIIYAEQHNTGEQAKLLGQIKHTLCITNENKEFGDVIKAAWSDFNNKNIFHEGIDVIALICGPLSATDTNDVRILLNQARYSENSDDFSTRIELGKFTSKKQRIKLDVFKSQLKYANNNVNLTNDELWRFLKSFYLLIYDLDIKGVTLSLLHTLIEQYSRNNADTLWCKVKEHVEWENENAGCIMLNTIPNEIRSMFMRKPVEVIPVDFVKKTLEIKTQNWSLHPYAHEMTIACIIGAWDENSKADKVIISRLARVDYENWILKLREVLQQPESPFIFTNGIWRVKNHKQLWMILGPRIFDDDLDRLKQCIVTVITERDPKFEMAKEERFKASIYGKILKYSQPLRKGLADSLALVGCCSSALSKCSLNKAKNISILSVREILCKADWVVWASLDDLLTQLAESAPDEFLKAVETSLLQADCQFKTLFSQEGNGVTGWNYLTGLLWALEALAWEEKFLTRVTIVLGELACYDPGGNWTNRPINSLTTIFLPWHPQTLASIEKRLVSIKILNREVPNVAWNLLISLLPNQNQISIGSHKPIWRNSIPKGWTEKVDKDEYWKQVSLYAEIAVDLAKDDVNKLNELIRNLDDLPRPTFEKVLILLSSDAVIKESEDIRTKLWNELINFTSKHEHYSDANWALDSTLITKIKKVANKLEPQNPINLYRRLFNEDNFDLYEKNGNWEIQEQSLENRRQQALKKIIDFGGINAIFQFVKKVELPEKIGNSLGIIAEASFDSIILPELLITDNKKIEKFTNAFVWSKQHKLGWNWVDNIDMKEWSKIQVTRFFIYLPFAIDTWKRVSNLLSNSEVEYWSKTVVNPYQSDINLNYAVDKLIKYGRPYAAIECIYKSIHSKQPIDSNRVVQALISAISSSEPSYVMNVYHIVEIIKVLQDDSTVNVDDLYHIEWSYLQLLNNRQGARPKLLEKRLANDSSFFCEIIRFAYRSKNTSEKQHELSKERRNIATNAWRLLHDWHTPPGLQDDGIFNCEKFIKWLEETKKTCTQSGHLEVALINIGKVLFYSHTDPSGFWINRVVADVLNDKDSEEMRNGFSTEILNSRGAHWVDPTGKTERELALKYRQQAEVTENAGYQRFATALRRIADSYNREVEMIIDENKSENKE